MLGFILLKNVSRKKNEYENLLLTLSTTEPAEGKLDRIVGLLKQYCTSIDLKRFDENDSLTEISLLVEYKGLEEFTKSKSALKEMDGSLAISFIDNKGMI